MTEPRYGSQPIDRRSEAEEATLYETLGGVLQNLLTRKLGVSAEIAERLVYETFMVYYGLDARPRDGEAWVIAAACRSAKTYLDRLDAPRATDVTDGDERAVLDALRGRDALALLSESSRTALRMRFAEHKSYEEIASALDVSSRYAERIVTKALVKLRSVMRKTEERR
jgi:DNA-directed RNA polymerase specialized sigma24 family protein